jgi:hypothetical protein
MIEETWGFDTMDEVYIEYRILREMEEEAAEEIPEDDF